MIGIDMVVPKFMQILILHELHVGSLLMLFVGRFAGLTL